jgi:hypothetical protein
MSRTITVSVIAITAIAVLAVTRSKSCTSKTGIVFNVNHNTDCTMTKLADVNDRIKRVASSLRGTQTGAKIAMRWNGRIDELDMDMGIDTAAVTTGKRSIRVCIQPDAPLDALVFVALHELAHVACDEIGHTPRFWDEFRYILDEATRIGAYSGHDPHAVVCGRTVGRVPPRNMNR